MTAISAVPIAVGAITFDFGNTLVRVGKEDLAAVVAETARAMRERGISPDEGSFLQAWQEERDRQFREELPLFREVNLPERVVRVLARLRGMPPPAANERWDDAAAGILSDSTEVEVAVEAYSSAFVARMPAVPDASTVLERLAASGFALAILSNWPLARTIDRYAQSRGWLPHLRAIVVSERVGTIKPHPAIFDHARDSLGVPAERILHVGDDWAADVVGARRAGWRAAYVRDRQGDTPLPTSRPPAAVEPGDAGTVAVAVEGERPAADLVIDELSDLVPLVTRWEEDGAERRPNA